MNETKVAEVTRVYVERCVAPVVALRYQLTLYNSLAVSQYLHVNDSKTQTKQKKQLTKAMQKTTAQP